MTEEDFKPEILDDESLKIYYEPGIVTLQTPSASLMIPAEDWDRILKKLKKI